MTNKEHEKKTEKGKMIPVRNTIIKVCSQRKEIE